MRSEQVATAVHGVYPEAGQILSWSATLKNVLEQIQPMKPDPALMSDFDDIGGCRQFVIWIQRAIVVALVLVFVSIVTTTPTEWQRYIPLVFLVLVLVISRWQLRHSPRRAIVVFAVGVWLMTSANVLQFAGVHSASMVIYPFSIGLVGWVLGRRWLAAMTLGTVGFILAVGSAELAGVYHPTPRAGTLVVMVQVAVVLTVISILAYTARQNLINSRDRAITLSNEPAQHNAKVELRERELLLLMDNVPAGVASFDAQSRLRRCNTRYATLMGAQPADIIGLPIADYIPNIALEQILPYWRRALGGVAQRYRRTNFDANTGLEYWLDVDVLPEFENGKVVGLFALLVDVTDRVQAEKAIRELNAELEQRVEHRTAELSLTLGKLHDSREELVRSKAKAALAALVASVTH